MFVKAASGPPCISIFVLSPRPACGVLHRNYGLLLRAAQAVS